MGWKVVGDAPDYNSYGWCEKTGMTCHTRLMKWVENLPVENLRYVGRDCAKAVRALPNGHKAGHYVDTGHYISMRIGRLRKETEALRKAVA